MWEGGEGGRKRGRVGRREERIKGGTERDQRRKDKRSKIKIIAE